jgi:hypothetical protein
MRIGGLARAAGAIALSLCGFAFVQPARADLAINVDKSRQQMTVSLNGERMFVWAVSTGAAGHDTPSGTFTPFRMEKDHFSKEWDDAPMPNSVFFTMKGHAIHGSSHVKALGTPASHGCVRLEPKNAALLFDLVKQEGMNKVRVSITGEIPNGVPQVARREAPAPVASGGGFFTRNFGNDRFFGDNNDRDVVGVLPPPPPPPNVRLRPGERLVREYRDGRTYYYRVPAPRRYGYADPYEPSPYPYYGR